VLRPGARTLRGAAARLDEAAVYDVGDAGDGHGRLGDVGRRDHLRSGPQLVAVPQHRRICMCLRRRRPWQAICRCAHASARGPRMRLQAFHN